jgi:hypothetical protein
MRHTSSARWTLVGSEISVRVERAFGEVDGSALSRLSMRAA